MLFQKSVSACVKPNKQLHLLLVCSDPILQELLTKPREVDFIHSLNFIQRILVASSCTVIISFFITVFVAFFITFRIFVMRTLIQAAIVAPS